MVDGEEMRALLRKVSKCCGKCGTAGQLPDPEIDQLSIAVCGVCGARYIRKHYNGDASNNYKMYCRWVRLRWWQRV